MTFSTVLLANCMRQRLGLAQAIAGDPRLIIVDEPTAGLDPEERLRFYRLLAELAARRTVLLSTHIVEDVAVLCPRFAVIRAGRLVAETSPGAARAALAGAVYEGTVASDEELRGLSRERTVTQAILVEGRNRVRIYEPGGRPPDGFEPVAPTLEDAYLLMVKGGAGEPLFEAPKVRTAEGPRGPAPEPPMARPSGASRSSGVSPAQDTGPAPAAGG